jgi:SagB-type dehydrogenase family enzyme
MNGSLSKLFHEKTNNDTPVGSASLDSKYWPREWKEIYYKEYSRSPKIILAKDKQDLESLEAALEKRHSFRDFERHKKITFEDLSTLLYLSCGEKAKKTDDPTKARRRYPSGGARYPLEVYLGVQRVENIEAGIYHYNVKEHALETLVAEPEYLESLKESLHSPWAREAAVFFIITALWNRTFVKYGDFGYRLILLEAGHMTQNLSLVAASLDIGCCNIAGFHNRRIDEILDIPTQEEESLYMSLLG